MMLKKIRSLGHKNRFVLNIVILAIFLIFYNVTKSILNSYHFTFRNILSIPLIVILSILLILLLLQTINFLYKLTFQKHLKPFLRILSGIGTVFISISLVISLVLGCMIFIVWHQPEFVVQMDGKKMVACVDKFLQPNVNYYDYVNLFVRGNQLQLLIDGSDVESEITQNEELP